MTRSAWRLVKTRFVASAFDGEGARRYGGRWNSVGTRVVYLAGSVSLAILEVLVHTEDVGLLGAYSICEVRFESKLVEAISAEKLPRDWAAIPASDATRAIGDRWVGAATSALLEVPSVVAPGEFNLLANPAHRDFGRLDIGEFAPFRFDSRLAPRDATTRPRGRRSRRPVD